MVASPLVLVVEDNAELRTVLREALASEGYRVLVARDEADALELLRTNPVDLLISDITSPPQAEGLDVVGREFPHLPVVALSASTRVHPALFFSALESPERYRTLLKPIRLRELLAVSREVLSA